MSAGDIIALAGLVILVLGSLVGLIWAASAAYTRFSTRKADDRTDDPLAIMQGQVGELHAWHNKPIREEDGTMVMSWEHSRDYRQAQKNMAETQALHTEILGGLLELVKELKDADS